MKPKEKKRSKFLINSLIVAFSLVSLTVLTWSIINIVKKSNKNPEYISNWHNTPDSFKQFSSDNAFRIILQNSKKGMSSQGTAWSWYYEVNSNNTINWYLMTNFHVVNLSVAYHEGYTKEIDGKIQISNEESMMDYYAKTKVTNFWEKSKADRSNYNFDLSKYDLNQSKYKTLFNSFSSKFRVNSFDIITDFNNPSYELFSDEKNYNLDMSLIKINFNYVNSQFKTPNIIDLYKKQNEISNSIEKIYIAGNPGKADALCGVLFEKQEWIKEDEELGGGEPFIEKLHAPYYYSSKNYDDFILGPGASGSSVYSIKDENDSDLNKIIPIGIYWGGKAIVSNKAFTPSFIPFIFYDTHNKYDIFANFIKSHNKNEV